MDVYIAFEKTTIIFFFIEKYIFYSKTCPWKKIVQQFLFSFDTIPFTLKAYMWSWFIFHVGHACVEGNMATERDVDELFEIKTALYTGNYQHCINECHKLRVTHFIYFSNFTETLHVLS